MKRILVVDNDRFMLKFMERLLEKEGHQVVTAADGLSALDILMDYLPEVIFVDLVMPNIDGKMLCQIIRSISKLQDVYLVILSAIAAEEKTNIAQLGVDACIAKGPLNGMSRHILDVLQQPLLASSQCRSGEVIGIKDVHPRSITKELLSVKKHFEIILEKMSEGIVEVNSAGRIVYANPAALLLIGMPEKKLLGTHFADVFDTKSRQQVYDLMQFVDGRPKAITEDLPLSLNEYLLTLDIRPLGETGFASIIILNDVAERERAKEALQKTHDELELRVKERTADLRMSNQLLQQEIAERREAESALQQSHTILRAIFDGTTDAIFLKDIDGRYVTINSAGAAAIDKPLEEIVGKDDVEIFGPEAGTQLMKADRAVVNSGETKIFEEIVSFGDKNVIWRSSKSPYFDADGTIIGLIGIARNITGLKQAEEAQFKAKLAAEAASRAKSEFLATMSHELRTPLNAIVGFSEILADQTFGKLNARQEKYINNILKSSRQLTGLINDILHLAEVETGKIQPELVEVDVFSTIHSVFNRFQITAAHKNITLKTDLEKPLPSITADEEKLKKILVNLFDNAVKFTPEGGNVRVSARIVDCRLATNDLKDADINHQCIEISVADSGIGIEPENQEQIFGTFEQIKSSYAREEGGTGLGLALTRKLVELHGGRILVESDGQGKGSTFTVFLPVRPRALAAKILLVDDEESVLDMLYLALTKDRNYVVEKAANGTEALIKLGSFQPDLLILDVFMPELDGVEVCRAIRKELKFSDMKVMIITGFPDDPKLKALPQMGFPKIYVKPFELKDFIKEVDDLLKK